MVGPTKAVPICKCKYLSVGEARAEHCVSVIKISTLGVEGDPCCSGRMPFPLPGLLIYNIQASFAVIRRWKISWSNQPVITIQHRPRFTWQVVSEWAREDGQRTRKDAKNLSWKLRNGENKLNGSCGKRLEAFSHTVRVASTTHCPPHPYHHYFVAKYDGDQNSVAKVLVHTILD